MCMALKNFHLNILRRNRESFFINILNKTHDSEN